MRGGVGGSGREAGTGDGLETKAEKRDGERPETGAGKGEGPQTGAGGRRPRSARGGGTDIGSVASSSDPLAMFHVKQVSQCSAILKQMFHVKHSKSKTLFANENPEASRPRESQPGYRTHQKSIPTRQTSTVAQKRPSPPPPDAKRSPCQKKASIIKADICKKTSRPSSRSVDQPSKIIPTSQRTPDAHPRSLRAPWPTGRTAKADRKRAHRTTAHRPRLIATRTSTVLARAASNAQTPRPSQKHRPLRTKDIEHRQRSGATLDAPDRATGTFHRARYPQGRKESNRTSGARRARNATTSARWAHS